MTDARRRRINISFSIINSSKKEREREREREGGGGGERWKNFLHKNVNDFPKTLETFRYFFKQYFGLLKLDSGLKREGDGDELS